MPKLLIFDLDGTLFNTAPGILTAVNRLLVSKGLSAVKMDSLVTYIGGGVMSMIEDIDRESIGHLGDLAQVEADFLHIYDEVYLEGSHLYDGVLNFLRTWRGQLAVLSNKKEKYVHSLIESSPLNEFKWEACFGGDSFASRKPNPEGLENVLKLAKADKSEALLIGDGHPDMMVAKNAGVRSFAVSFGYANIDELNEIGTHGQLDHFNELAEMIRKLS